MRDTVYLIGGSGDVGARLARLLVEAGEGEVVICGRDLARAEAVARDTGGQALALDASRPEAAVALVPEAVVVNLTEATDPGFAARYLAKDGAFIDTSASINYLERLEAVGRDAARGLMVPQSGLLPGLTNLVADHLVSTQAGISRIEIALELGMGRHHGEQATIWTFRSFGQGYDLKQDGQSLRVRPGLVRRRVTFPPDTSTRLAIGFPFSDQTVIARDPRLAGAASYLALAPGSITRAVDLALRLGTGPILARYAKPLARLFAKFPALGPEGTRLVVEGFNAAGGQIARFSLTSVDQAVLTALVLAETVDAVRRCRETGLVPITRLLNAPATVAGIVSRVPETIAEGLEGEPGTPASD